MAAGQIGQPPVEKGQVFQYIMTTLGRLTDDKQFADIIIKTDQDRKVRIRDVGRAELGAQAYDQTCTLNGNPSVALAVYQLPGSNALDTSNLVRTKMEELKHHFLPGMDYRIVYDTTPFIKESISEVFNTLRDAVILVAIVVLLFLQNWRSAIIPLIAVPVAVIGTFAAMAAMEFSLNNLTLFGLVLAIGIVVDDAIVVVEAVEHHIEHGMKPREATILAMEQVSGPVVAVALVLTAVFVPCAFITGIMGQFFRQFAVTIAVSTVISAFNSLTLSPALAALLLRPRQKGVYEALPRLAVALIGGWIGFQFLSPRLLPWLEPHLQHLAAARHLDSWMVDNLVPGASVVFGALVGWVFGRPINTLLGATFHVFNVGFDYTAGLYTRAVGRLVRVSVLVLLLYGGLLYLTYWSFTSTPTGFIPAQDKGYLLVNLQLPDASSVQRTEEVMRRLENVAERTLGVKNRVAVSGTSLLLNVNAPNFGSMYLMLDDFHNRNNPLELLEKKKKLREKMRREQPGASSEGLTDEDVAEFKQDGSFIRSHPKLTADAIAERLQAEFAEEIPDGQVQLFGAPPIEGLGTAGGFKIMIQDLRSTGPEDLQETAETTVAHGNNSPSLKGLYTSFRAKTPWLNLDIDRAQAMMMGVSMADVFTTLQVYLGSLYVNDLTLFGRTWQVNVQADTSFRGEAKALGLLQVRNNRGQMVPLGSVAKIRDQNGPVMLVRYNMYPAAGINGSPGQGVSSGQAIQLMEDVVKEELPATMRFEWTELAKLQLETGSTAMKVFVLAVLLVFLVLAAQYESWSLPLAVILVVPMCLLFSVAGVVLARMDINIFTQVGFVVLVGLACKNAILIVEFARARRTAARRATRPRWRPAICVCGRSL